MAIEIGDGHTIRSSSVYRGGGGGDELAVTFLQETPEGVESVWTILADLAGGGGNDTLSATLHTSGWSFDGGLAAASLVGGEGDDELALEMVGIDASLFAEMFGGGGDDEITLSLEAWVNADYVSSVDAIASGGAGNDRIDIALTGTAMRSVFGGSGDDHITIDQSGGAGTVTPIDSGDGADTISVRMNGGGDYGGRSGFEIDSGDGADQIEAEAALGGELQEGINSISAGTGDDTVSAGVIMQTGSNAPLALNEAFGGDGDDRLTATIELRQNEGDEYEASGQNILDGSAGNDRLTAIVTGDGEGDAALHSEVFGGAGDDRLKVSGGGDNFLWGNIGDDTLLGGVGDDFLIGGQGNDYLRAYAGDDTFEFQSARNGERDRIDGFTIGDDTIDLSRIDANVFRGGDQAFSFGTQEGTGRLWIEDYGTKSVLHADTGRAVLDLVLLDGSVTASDYGADSFSVSHRRGPSAAIGV